jgi:hypothetical protein
MAMPTAPDPRALLGETFRDPDAGARSVLSVPWPREALWLGLLLTAIVSAILATLMRLLTGGPGPLTTPLMALPTVGAAIQVAMSWLLVQGLWRVGRAFGGRGEEPGAFALVVLLQGGLIVLQAVQLLVLPLPFLVSMLGIAAVGLFFWWLTRFAMVLHGFENPWRVLGTTMLVMVAAVATLGAVLGSLGLMAGGQ